MTLLERLSQELKAAMLSKDTERLSTLRLLKSAIGYAQIGEMLQGRYGLADALTRMARETRRLAKRQTKAKN